MCKIHKSTDNIIHNPYIFQKFNVAEKPKPQFVNGEDIELQNKKYQLDKLTKEIETLQKKADSIISRAESRAGKIIEKANFDATAVLNASSIKGYKEGMALANEKTEQIISNANTQMTSILEKALRNTEKIVDGLESQMLDLSFDIAEKIIGIEIDRSSDAYKAIINKGLAAIKSGAGAKIYMQADELLKVQDSFKDTEELKFAQDIRLKKGDIIIETEKGKIEAGVRSQLDKIKKAFMQEAMSMV